MCIQRVNWKLSECGTAPLWLDEFSTALTCEKGQILGSSYSKKPHNGHCLGHSLDGSPVHHRANTETNAQFTCGCWREAPPHLQPQRTVPTVGLHGPGEAVITAHSYTSLTFRRGRSVISSAGEQLTGSSRWTNPKPNIEASNRQTGSGVRPVGQGDFTSLGMYKQWLQRELSPQKRRFPAGPGSMNISDG